MAFSRNMEPQILEKLRLTTQDKIWTKILGKEDLSLNTNFASFFKKMLIYFLPSLMKSSIEQTQSSKWSEQ